MTIVVYLLIALGATLLGACTGGGGGILIKPILDLMGDYDAPTSGVLSAVTLLTMSAVSCIRQLPQQKGIHITAVVLLGLGSVAGGFCGQYLFDLICGSAGDAQVTVVQNAVLGGLIAVIFVYMLFRERIRGLQLKHPVFYPVAGLFLGVLSSFLGVGGGPINVAALTLLFGMDMKRAGFCSIAVILFAQASKIITVAVDTGFGPFDLTVLPYMCIGAVAGALIGSFIKKKSSERVVTVLFNVTQLIIIALCIVNIVRFSV